MTAKVVYIERKFWDEKRFNRSIEIVFEQIAKKISTSKFIPIFSKLPYGNSFSDLLKNLLFAKFPDADIYHITGQIHYIALRLPSEKTVLTVHDIGFLHTRKGLRRFLIKKLYLDFPLKKVKYITTVSEATKKEILGHCKIEPEKILVIENPLQDIFNVINKKRFNKDCPTILHIGVTENKNLSNLIKACKGLKCRLKIIGNLSNTQIDELNSAKVTFENAFGLGDMEMKREYEKADIVAFCSYFEGFGLPIIEAQASGTPVVTSNLSPMKEVSGGAAFLADPYNFNAIREGILKVINDDEFREKIIAEGLENIKKFNAKVIADRYSELYTKILEQ